MEEEVVAEEEVEEAGVEVEEVVAAVEDVATEEEGQVGVVVVDEVATTGKIFIIDAFFSSTVYTNLTIIAWIIAGFQLSFSRNDH